ncbi:MAG: phosphoglycerate kinase [Dehalococcoidia bacterium]|nr:phosphoglycerate kinase [Dehalococcoidia bacterium]
MGKQTVRDINVQGERVLLRADLNVPLENGAVADDTRIRESLPTIQYLVTGGASVLVCSHLGRPKGERNPDLSLAPVGERLAELLGQPVAFAEDCIGPPAVEVAQGLGAGDVALLENLRFHPEEEANDRVFAAVLGTLATVYVNDAFGAAHRAHASTVGVANLLPGVAGLLLEKEVRYLGSLVADPPRPFAAIVGGAKVSTKIAAIDHLLPKLDRLLVGGGMANTFLKAKGVDVGASLVEDDLLDLARDILARADAAGVTVSLPEDAVVATRLSADAEADTVPIDAFPPDRMILDVGPTTLASFEAALADCAAVVWNGPLGVFEIDQFANGSFSLARSLAELDATTVVGGGETAAVVARSGLAERFTHVSTGGGASLEMLEGRELPGVAALLDA